MKANQAFKQADEAVSPVIGVILMVAITVVLAAVVFVLVTKLSSDQKDDSPELTYIFDLDDDGDGGTITITQWTGSQTALVDNLRTAGTATCTTPWMSMDLVADQVGEEIDCTGAASGETFILVWEPTDTVVLRKEL